MFGLDNHILCLSQLCDAIATGLTDLDSQDPRARIAEGMLGGFKSEVEQLRDQARGSPHAEGVALPAEIVEDDFPRLLGADFYQRLRQLEDVVAPVVQYCCDAADQLGARAKNLGNHPLQKLAVSIRRSACALQELVPAIMEAIGAARLHWVVKQSQDAKIPVL